ncbi:MAG: hypothetical protein ACRCSF_00070 [Mycobacteriaceae bacterium]
MKQGLSARAKILLEFIVALLVFGAAVWAWQWSITTTLFPPVTEGGPARYLSHYSGSRMAAFFTLLILSGILFVDGVRRVRNLYN